MKSYGFPKPMKTIRETWFSDISATAETRDRNIELFRLRAGSMGTIEKRWFSIRITLTSHVAPADPERWHGESYGYPESFTVF